MEQATSRRRRVLSDSAKHADIQRQAESGKTLSVFCRDEGIALSRFQSWKKKFAPTGGVSEISAPAQTFPVPVAVVLASGTRVVTSSGCAPSWLAELVRSFATPPC